MDQTVMAGFSEENLKKILDKEQAKRIMVVCGQSFKRQNLFGQFMRALEEHETVFFSDFTSNPDYESVRKGVRIFKERKCDFIIGAGGGSALDVAKCIKAFANLNENEIYLKQKLHTSRIPVLAIPTTAGTGSEATCFAVIYYDGAKQSVSHESCLPEYVVLEPLYLRDLPELQRKVTMFDALCHAVESFWAIGATEHSRKLAGEAIRKIMKYGDLYISNIDRGNAELMQAANIAGKAINITKTTAGHAMCYKMTKMFDLPHGQAAALCVAQLWPFMVRNIDQYCEPYERKHLEEAFGGIAQAMKCKDVNEAIVLFQSMIKKYGLDFGATVSRKELDELMEGVNTERLQNTPLHLGKAEIRNIYKMILQEKEC